MTALDNPATPPAGPGPGGPNPGPLLQLGTGFQASKVLLSAVELGVFGALGGGPRTAAELQEGLGLHPRSALDFLDALVALGMLEREGDRYANTPTTGAFLDPAAASYVGGFLEMANSRLYGFWDRLTEALRTGEPQNEAREGRDFFAELYTDDAALRDFLDGMAASMQFVAGPLAALVPWDRYASFVDVGGASGALATRLLGAHPHLTGTVFDLPPVGPHVRERAEAGGVGDRLGFVGGDFFADPLPAADVVVLGHVLHDWGLDHKKALVEAAHEALPAGGALVAYDAMVDDDRRHNVFSFLMSLNMLIETPGGFEYRAADLAAWCTEAGFSQVDVVDMPGPDTLVVATK